MHGMMVMYIELVSTIEIYNEQNTMNKTQWNKISTSSMYLSYTDASQTNQIRNDHCFGKTGFYPWHYK